VWSEEFDEDDGLDSAWDGADTESETLPCPSCGQMVFEETEKCPYCGDWIMPLRAAGSAPHWARVVGVVLAILLVAALSGGVVRWLL
jgi:hypothetical protein